METTIVFAIMLLLLVLGITYTSGYKKGQADGEYRASERYKETIDNLKDLLGKGSNGYNW